MAKDFRVRQDQQKEMLAADLLARTRTKYRYEWIDPLEDNGKFDRPAPYYQPPAGGACLILTKLPYEIRVMIFRILFIRPCKIVPCWVRYELEVRYPEKRLAIYSYLWDTRVHSPSMYWNTRMRQMNYDELGLPRYDGSAESVVKQWVTSATPEQLAMIKDGKVQVDKSGDVSLLRTYDPKLGVMVEHYVCCRDPYPTKIVNRASIYTTGISGVRILATCKQFLTEGAPILYG
ncbi:hypothetical protein N431DRAFT_469833 [Stipitochalara longipes BDJ]|nr:hypothetical protein N431DRAFT_469833 [Stipitochalara longipes BDJ]